jgi:hypothetical protein
VVGEQRAGVEQEPADQRALPIVDRPRSGEPQQIAGVGSNTGVHQK